MLSSERELDALNFSQLKVEHAANPGQISTHSLAMHFLWQWQLVPPTHAQGDRAGSEAAGCSCNDDDALHFRLSLMTR